MNRFAVLLAAVTLAGCSAGEEKENGAAGSMIGDVELVYALDGELRSARSDGSGDRRIGSGDITTWGADGRVAVASGRTITILDGTDAREIELPCRRRRCDDPRVDSVAVSRDGKRIAFSRTTGRGAEPPHELAVMDADGSHVKMLVYDPGSDLGGFADLDWSPDGTRIAFVAGQASIDVIGSNGRDRTDIASAGTLSTPRWSPDGKRVAYAIEDEEGHLSAWIVSAEGGPSREVGSGECPEWTPDARALILTREGPRPFVVVGLDGKGIGELPIHGAGRCPRIRPV